MTVEVTMPKLGFDMEEGTLVRWCKKAGEQVKAGEPLFEVETDKATIEVEATQTGKLTEVIADEGQTVKVGSIIAYLADNNDSQPARVKETANITQPDKPQEMPAPQATVDHESLDTPRTTSTDSLKVSPLARRIAKEHGIPLDELTGTGPGGMIIKRDILAAKSVSKTIKTSAEPIPVAISTGERIPLTRMRQIIARRMSLSNAQVPQFSVSIQVEMDKALDLRSRYNLIHPDHPLTINDLFVRAAALALTRFSRLNSSFDETALIYHASVNIGIAVGLESGLLTVVVKNAAQKSLSQISQESKILIQRARNGKIKPEDIEGSTFTISNLGMLGVDEFRAIINPPEAAILAIGAVQVLPVYVDEEWKPCSIAKLNLTVDHRVSDGAEGAHFLKLVRTYLQEPVYLIE